MLAEILHRLQDFSCRDAVLVINTINLGMNISLSINQVDIRTTFADWLSRLGDHAITIFVSNIVDNLQNKQNLNYYNVSLMQK